MIWGAVAAFAPLPVSLTRRNFMRFFRIIWLSA
nr:MAG TPA: hypothetical protein [Caudoviricetes sp.]DAM74960.1 MAG TPA: hypothetical protein [Caudoviricetes sp.]